MRSKIIIPILSLLSISIVVFFRWLFFSPAAGGDWIYYYPQALKDASFHSSWISFNALGSVDLLLWRFPVDILKSFLGFLNFSSSYSDRIIVFWPSLIIGNLSAFFIVRKVTKSELAGFIGALVFNYNTYYLASNSAILLYSSGSVSLLSLLFFMNALERKSISNAVLSAITLFIAGSCDFRIAYLTYFILIFYFIFWFLFINLEKISKKNIIKYVKIILIHLTIFGLLNIYWLLDFYSAHSISNNAITSRSLFGNEFLNINYALTLFHPFWTGVSTIYFINQSIIIYFWLIPILSFASLWLHKRNKYIVFFGILTLIGIFLTKQVGQPFSNIYPFLFKHLPGFNAFREASKFYFLISIGYAVLIGAFTNWLWQFNKLSKYLKFALIFLITLIFLFNLKTVITGEIKGIFINRQIPKDYEQISNPILKNEKFSRTLWVPFSSAWSMYSNQRPLIRLIEAMDTDWKEFIPQQQNIYQTPAETGMIFMKQNFSDKLLDLSSVRYVIVPLKDPENDLNIFQFYGKPRQYYIDELNKLKYLHKLNMGTKEIVVYENYNYRPHIYVTKNSEQLAKNIPYQNIQFDFVNSTEYSIKLRSAKEPIYINFSEAYHPQWKLRAGNFSWITVLINKDYMLSDKNHLKNDATLNSYYLNPNKICEEFECKKNNDGSYDIDLTLYFAPQSYMYLGLIISGTTFIFTAGYLAFILGRKMYERKN